MIKRSVEGTGFVFARWCRFQWGVKFLRTNLDFPHPTFLVFAWTTIAKLAERKDIKIRTLICRSHAITSCSRKLLGSRSSRKRARPKGQKKNDLGLAFLLFIHDCLRFLYVGVAVFITFFLGSIRFWRDVYINRAHV